MHLTFHGAARTVTGSMHLLELEDGRQILFDCGLFQGKRAEAKSFNSELPFNATDVDAVLLSHAHMDHAGLLPKLVRDGFRGKIWATHATRDLCALMLMDSARIQQSDADYFNRRIREKGEDKIEPLYGEEDAEAAIRLISAVNYDSPFEPLDGVRAEFREAGHILGAATVTVSVRAQGRDWRVGYTGDFGNPDPPLLRTAATMPDCDWLICESTYGGTTLPTRESAKEDLREVIQRTYDRGGRVIIPAFAVGRTQEVVYYLNKLWNEERLPRMPVFVDSPLAVNATDVFRLHPELFDKTTRDLMLEDPDPFGFEKLEYVRSAQRSREINSMNEPLVVIATSGMAEAGRILHHLAQGIGDARNTVLIVGYQAENTLGRRIVERQKRVNIFGKPFTLNAEVVVMNSFSAHADEPHMVEFIERLDKERLREVFLVHGEFDRQAKMIETLETRGYARVSAPERGTRVALLE
jgi:metallo-beta-lactamase family protein